MSLRYIVAGTVASAYKFYEAENAVTAAEDALRSLDAKMKSYEAEIAKAKKTVSKGMTDISEARSAANTADSDVSAAHKAVETAKSKLEEKLMAQNKIALRLKALEADVEHARGMMAAKTKEHESTAVEVVSRKLAVDKARADAMKAAQGLSLPPVFR